MNGKMPVMARPISAVNAIKRNVMSRSRARKEEQFYYLCDNPSSTILDVGVTDETRRGMSQTNRFLKTYRYPPETYTGLGVHDLSGMGERYSGKTFVTYEGKKFPFLDTSFDWVHCNAVIEHVGSSSEQLWFLNEMLRVSKFVFFTTPNKYFPIETHTLWPFIHWFDEPFYWLCARYRPWLSNDKFTLLSESMLLDLLNNSCALYSQIFANRFCSFPMTYTIVCSKAEPIDDLFGHSVLVDIFR